ncbi:hypothetical protein L2Y96_18050 [Luteibacter aegosomaticola]|uniref:hypothetical protein n=1 Tax=Luteibacter aegosomaticola TaxID=2911538 RepID=UPI001FFBEF0B|nr:hypothetical protein [Luteibacter aegosomaticola]UPG89282.1 hypothetical protein L2Y96_18050 [Luteibacter aegosomaticola]
MPIEISVRSNLKQVSKQLSALAYKQLDFAASQAINDLAKQVAAAEKENIKATFEKPKPFTINAVGVKGSNKRNLTAVVFVRPVAAKYLAPYEEGGAHKLPGRALLNPKNIRLDQYGQLTRATLARLKARSDVFIGPVNTKNGAVNGVWQRVRARRGQPAGLKLLIRFGDALPVKKRLGYGDRARDVIDAGWKPAFDRAMARALATAR